MPRKIKFSDADNELIRQIRAEHPEETITWVGEEYTRRTGRSVSFSWVKEVLTGFRYKERRLAEKEKVTNCTLNQLDRQAIESKRKYNNLKKLKEGDKVDCKTLFGGKQRVTRATVIKAYNNYVLTNKGSVLYCEILKIV